MQFFLVMTCFLLREYNLLSKKELHLSLFVRPKDLYSISLGIHVCK